MSTYVKEWLSPEWPSFKRLLRRTWVLWLIPTVLGIVVGMLLNWIATPVYEASTMVLVLQRPGAERPVDYTSVLATKELLPTFDAIIRSNRVLTAAVEDLDEDWSAESLQANLQVSNPSGTVLLNIRVQHPSPQQALDAADAIVSQFIGGLLETFPLLIARPADDPVVTNEPVSPQPFAAPVVGGLVGWAVGLGLSAWFFQHRPDRQKRGEPRRAP